MPSWRKVSSIALRCRKNDARFPKNSSARIFHGVSTDVSMCSQKAPGASSLTPAHFYTPK